MASNSFVNYSYYGRRIWDDLYQYDITKDDETISTPNFHSGTNDDPDLNKIRDHVKNFEYYVDNGRDAYDACIQSTFIGKLEEFKDAATLMVILIDALFGEDPSAEKIINALKGVASIIPVPDAFFIGHLAIVLANLSNCKNGFNTLKSLV